MLIGERKKVGYYQKTPPNLIKQTFIRSWKVSGPGAGPRVAAEAYGPSLYSFKDPE